MVTIVNIAESSLEGLMLKLKLQYFGHLMRSADSLEKTLMLGGIGDRRRRQLRMIWLDGITWYWLNRTPRSLYLILPRLVAFFKMG